MNRDDIIRMAQEAGFYIDQDWIEHGLPGFERFAELIILECVNVALEQKKRVEDQEVFNSHDASWNRARIQQSQRIVEKINEHFGVEE